MVVASDIASFNARSFRLRLLALFPKATDASVTASGASIVIETNIIMANAVDADEVVRELAGIDLATLSNALGLRIEFASKPTRELIQLKAPSPPPPSPPPPAPPQLPPTPPTPPSSQVQAATKVSTLVLLAAIVCAMTLVLCAIGICIFVTRRRSPSGTAHCARSATDVSRPMSLREPREVVRGDFDDGCWPELARAPPTDGHQLPADLRDLSTAAGEQLLLHHGTNTIQGAPIYGRSAPDMRRDPSLTWPELIDQDGRHSQHSPSVLSSADTGDARIVSASPQGHSPNRCLSSDRHLLHRPVTTPSVFDAHGCIQTHNHVPLAAHSSLASQQLGCTIRLEPSMEQFGTAMGSFAMALGLNSTHANGAERPLRHVRGHASTSIDATSLCGTEALPYAFVHLPSE